jgi:hypothetical protein
VNNGIEKIYDEPVVEPITFSFVHGSFHNKQTWKYVRSLLKEKGYQSVASDLPIDDPEATYDDYADIVENDERISGAGNIYRVGWSRGVNAAIRKVGDTVCRLGFLAGIPDETTMQRPQVEEADQIPPRYSYEQLYERAQIWMPRDMSRFKPELAEFFFYHDWDAEWDASEGKPAWVEESIEQLREQRRAKQPPLAEIPSVPIDCIVPIEDRVINPRRQVYEAQRLAARVIPIPGGHSPHLCRPQFLTDLLIDLAESQPLDIARTPEANGW